MADPAAAPPESATGVAPAPQDDPPGATRADPGAGPATTARASQVGPGAQVGPYTLVEAIGEGGMGSVFLAEQARPVRRQVALKIIKAGMNSGRVVARFEAERQVLARMDHPHIAKVFDAGTTDSGLPYFVMERVVGVPITEFADAARLAPRDRLELFLPVCRAIEHAHRKGIIHRDIKPSNILVAEHDGRAVPVVIDFGIAKATEPDRAEQTAFTEMGVLIGTLEYMSPEQAEMDGRGIDTRSDVYSLGVVLYELLTGTTPLERARLRSTGVVELLRIIREEEPPGPSVRLTEPAFPLASIAALRRTESHRLAALLRGEVDWIVLKALEKDRSRRYPTAQGLARDIERHLNGEAVEARPPTLAYRAFKFAARHRVPLLTTAGFLALVGIGLLANVWQARRAVRAELRARTEMAAVRVEAGHLDEAIRLYDRLIPDQDAQLGPVDPATMASFLALGKLYARQGHTNETITILNVAMNRLRAAHVADDDPRLLDIPYHLGQARLDEGGNVQAIGPLTAATVARTRILGMNSHPTVDAYSHLGLAYQRAGRVAESLAPLETAYRAQEGRLGPRSGHTRWNATILSRSLTMQGKILLDGGDPARAEAMLRRSLTLAEAAAPDAWETFEARSLLGRSLFGLGRFAEAEPLLVAGFRGLKARDYLIPWSISRQTVARAGRLVILFYDETNRHATAGEWREIVATR